MKTRQEPQRRTTTVVRTTWRLAKGGASVLAWASAKTRSATSATMNWGLGPNAYRRHVDDVVGRLADALNVLDGVITAQHLEIERLQDENARLRSGQS